MIASGSCLELFVENQYLFVVHTEFIIVLKFHNPLVTKESTAKPSLIFFLINNCKDETDKFVNIPTNL